VLRGCHSLGAIAALVWVDRDMTEPASPCAIVEATCPKN
jgi:hypothetical protein